jgi:hypothetical protein
MMEDINILTARRGYVFRGDDIRLSLLTVPLVQDQIKQAFNFQIAGIGAPMPTFGPVPQTIPAGVVFDAGAWISPDQQFVPIRFLHIEPLRIVIDVAGPSSNVDSIFQQFREVLRRLEAVTKAPLIGEPVDTRDYTEITARFSWAPTELFKDSVQSALRRAMGADDPSGHRDIVPTLFLMKHGLRETFGGLPLGDPQMFQFAVRAGTVVQDHIYISTAPLDSDSHIAYLRNLDEALAGVAKPG